MSFTNSNTTLHNINQGYLNADPPSNYDFNHYVNYYLYNCTDITNVSFLNTEKFNFTFQGILYNLVDFVISLLNDLLNGSVTPNNLITNFFNRLLTLRNSNIPILGNINFGAFIRTSIVNYVKNQTTGNKTILFNSIQTIMNNSTTYPEYNLVSTLNTTSPVYQMSMITDSVTFSDTYNSFNTVEISVTNTGLYVNNNISVNNTHTKIEEFKDDELVNAKFLKSVSYNTSENALYVNGNKAFYFK